MNLDFPAVNAMPADDRVKFLVALMYQGDDSMVSTVLSKATPGQVHETCLRALRLLTDSRVELAGLKGINLG
jgi:hypothetical protein